VTRSLCTQARAGGPVPRVPLLRSSTIVLYHSLTSCRQAPAHGGNPPPRWKGFSGGILHHPPSCQRMMKKVNGPHRILLPAEDLGRVIMSDGRINNAMTDHPVGAARYPWARTCPQPSPRHPLEPLLLLRPPKMVPRTARGPARHCELPPASVGDRQLRRSSLAFVNLSPLTVVAMVRIRRRRRGCGAVILHHPQRCQRGMKKRLIAPGLHPPSPRRPQPSHQS
jgi:hypothetical protein